MPPSYRRDPSGGALTCTAYDNTLDLRHQGLRRVLAISSKAGRPRLKVDSNCVILAIE
jgi:hypothetical protein